MTSILITTSRKTSNRVRSFIRDLSAVLRDSLRFNRGGMSKGELVSRINQSGAKAALVVTLSKGNPGSIIVIQPDGSQLIEIFLESAALCREVRQGGRPRIGTSVSVFYGPESSDIVKHLAQIISAVMGVVSKEAESVESIRQNHSNGVIIWFQNLPSDRILWTFFTSDGTELGPRMRVRNTRS